LQAAVDLQIHEKANISGFHLEIPRVGIAYRTAEGVQDELVPDFQKILQM